MKYNKCPVEAECAAAQVDNKLEEEWYLKYHGIINSDVYLCRNETIFYVQVSRFPMFNWSLSMHEK